MGMEIRPFSEEWLGAVRAFNLRLRAAQLAEDMRLPENAATELLPGSELYIAVENGAVRGGYVLRQQQFYFGGEPNPVAHYRLPVSEGLVNKAYAMVGALMLRHALKMQPMLYALGMGSYEHPLARMLQAMKWSLCAVPFQFRMVHAGRCLRQLGPLRQPNWRRVVVDIAAATGVGGLGIQAVQWTRTMRIPSGWKAESAGTFGKWADVVWQSCRADYRMIALRDSETLERLYPASDPRFVRLRVSRRGETIGWAVLLDTAMHQDRYFGDLRLGTLVDCLAAPADARAVTHAARVELERRGVDLIISNQGHSAWSWALREEGCWNGPSNFLFAASPQLVKLLTPFESAQRELHLNRGDGDGPIHL
ncbi:MAG TPA: hypothetical protein VG675_01490 [Bryobacteraceae bacterium]|nr:hypothetical protein [Bryobacteraceae bacterium]